MNINYVTTVKLLTEQEVSPEEQQRIHQAAIEREKNWAKGAATAGAVGSGGIRAYQFLRHPHLLVQDASIPAFVIGAALSVATISGISAGIAWLVARATRAGYKKQQIEKAVQVLKQRTKEKQNQQSQQ